MDLTDPGTQILVLLAGLAFLFRRQIWGWIGTPLTVGWSWASQMVGTLVTQRAANSAPSKAWHDDLPVVEAPSTEGAVDLTKLDHPTRRALETVPGAGLAIAHTPNDFDAVNYAVAYMRRDCAEAFPQSPVLSYGVPFGWYKLEGNTPQEDRVALNWSRLGAGFDNVLISGKKRSGKDNLAQWMTLCLMAQHTPQDLQLVVIDTKGVDWGGFANKAHTLRHFKGVGGLGSGKAFLTAERERRENILASYNGRGIRKWQNIPDGERPPFLWIVITELTLVVQELGKQEAQRWLNAELSTWRALGGYIAIVTQTVSNMDTNWRGQIDLFISGAQTADDADEPNVGLKTGHIKKLGAVPPSELPPVTVAGGVFCITSPAMRAADNVRSSFIDDVPLVEMLNRFPDKVPVQDTAPTRRTESPFAVDFTAEDVLGDLLTTKAELDALNQRGPVDQLEFAPPPRPLQWFRDQGGKRLDNDQLVEYFVRRMLEEPEATPRRIALELWSSYGGDGPNSSYTRVAMLLPRIQDEVASRAASASETR